MANNNVISNVKVNDNAAENKVNLTQFLLTVTGPSWTTSRAVGIPYLTLDGQWRLRINIRGTIPTNTALVISIAGVVFSNAAGSQVINISTDNFNGFVATVVAGTGNITMNSVTSDTIWGVSGDVELESKPTFAA